MDAALASMSTLGVEANEAGVEHNRKLDADADSDLVLASTSDVEVEAERTVWKIGHHQE